jgi:hypothetical protein
MLMQQEPVTINVGANHVAGVAAAADQSRYAGAKVAAAGAAGLLKRCSSDGILVKE